MEKRKKTLITTVIIIVVLVILSMLTYIAYEAHLKRSKVAEAFLLVTPIQNELSHYAEAHGGFDVNAELSNSSFGLPQPLELKGTYIKSVVAHKYAHSSEVLLMAAINTEVIPDLEDDKGQVLSEPYIRFSGTYQGHDIVWGCVSNLSKKYLPKNCRSIKG